MIQSMTGYGKAEHSKDGMTLRAEIRSLNSKFLDINLRLPLSIKGKEIEIRNLITEKLQRGKVDLFISIENGTGERASTFNLPVAKHYYDELKSLAKELGTEKKNLLQVILQMPDVMNSSKTEISEEHWKQTLMTVHKAADELNHFRVHEGTELQKAFRQHISQILSCLKEAAHFEKARIESIRMRIHAQLTELLQSEDYDKNRFEQELIYYLERMDFTEEKVRLQSHCEFFLKTLDDADPNGRKLGFISQEIGREINTLGAKANDASIQKLVVQMKDELEKIKEQLLNVL